MTIAQEMLATHPAPSNLDREAVSRAIEQLMNCGFACQACADACLGEDQVSQLTRCIRTDLDCADVCAATQAVLTRQGGEWEAIRQQIQVCETMCRVCAEECDHHANRHDHCRLCAEACRRCETACAELLQAAPAMA